MRVFFNLENLCVVTSRGSRSAACTFLISRLSVVVVVTSVVGHLDSSCDYLCGPFLHGVDVGSAEGSIPADLISEISRIGLRWHMSPYY
jgi:hypothetical protein